MNASLYFLHYYSPSHVLNRYMRLAFVIYGCHFAKFMGCLQTAHLTKSEFMSVRKSIVYTFSVLNGNVLYALWSGAVFF